VTGGGEEEVEAEEEREVRISTTRSIQIETGDITPMISTPRESIMLVLAEEEEAVGSSVGGILIWENQEKDLVGDKVGREEMVVQVRGF
jgi:hypothetical protein